jgi:hypothetical protein
MPLDYQSLKLQGAPALGRAKVAPPANITEWFFSEAVFAAEELQRQGQTINADTLHAQNPRLGKPNLAILIDSRAWRAALAERGIQNGMEPLSPRQMAAVAIYMDMTVGLSHKQKLARAKVTNAEWTGWMRQPQFAQYLSDVSSELLQASVPVARQRIAEGVDRGDRSFIELMLKMTGNDPDQAVDVRAVLMAVFTILDEEIQDGALLARIGAKVGSIVQGGLGQDLQRSVVTLSASAESSYPVTEATPTLGTGPLISED